MKKNLLLLAMFIVGMTMNAQFILKDHDGNVIQDGHVAEFGVAGYPGGSWDYFVHNPSTTEEIHMKALFESAVNTNGSFMEICFDLCYTGIVIGQVFPPGNSTVNIAPGGETGSGNHLLNTYDGSDIIEYVFKFYQVDGTGNEIGDAVRVTYIYNPTLGVGDHSELDVTIASTIISNEMIVKTIEELDMVVYNLQGKIVKSQKLEIGQQTVNMSGLSSQMYIVKFANNNGATKTTKIIVK